MRVIRPSGPLAQTQRLSGFGITGILTAGLLSHGHPPVNLKLKVTSQLIIEFGKRIGTLKLKLIIGP